VLADLKKFSGKAIAIAGRLDCSWSLADRTCHLAEDRCERSAVVRGSLWPSRILLVDYWKQGMPKPPADKPQIEKADNGGKHHWFA